MSFQILGSFSPDDVLGKWIAVPYNASDFTASGTMTWTVDQADLITFAYQLTGKTMTIQIWTGNTSIGGTVSNELYIRIPEGHKAARFMDGLAKVFEGGTNLLAEAIVDPALGDKFKIIKWDGANYAASTNTTNVRSQITFEIQ